MGLHLLCCLFWATIASAVVRVASSRQQHEYEESTGEAEMEFPPLLDADDIGYFFGDGTEGSEYDIDGLHWALANVFVRSERNPNSHHEEDRDSASGGTNPLPQQLIARGGGSTYTTAYKLAMDIEQAEYLLAETDLNTTDPELAKLYATHVLPIFRQILAQIPPLEQLERTAGLYAFRKQDYDLGIGAIYNKALHATNFDALRDAKTGHVVSLLNSKLDTDRIQRQWTGNIEPPDKTLGGKGILVVDDLLSPEALRRIRQVLLESTVWYQTKMPLKFGGYVGAYIDDGLHDQILLQLAQELHQALPRIMQGHPLQYLWAYKYDSNYTGINLHADQAAVNVNIWVTPDEANLDTASGGLVVYTAKPPPEWAFEDYNTNTQRVVDELLQPTQFANVTIPHKQNRAVIFDSALFHQTDKFNFKQGYQNRRINLTILYGKMQVQEPMTRDESKSEEL